MTEKNNKINPFIQMSQIQLLPGEFIAPLNPYTNKGYIIAPYYYVTTYGRYFSIAKGMIEPKQLGINTTNYYEIQVITNQGQKHLLAHRGVIASFYPRFDMYNLQVDHINGDHFDNRLCNLRWVTGIQNIQYAVNNNLRPARSRAIDDEAIIQIMDLAYHNYTDKEICEMLPDVKITPETVRHIRSGNIIYGEILKRLGLKPITRKAHTYLTQKDYDKIAELYESGMSLQQIADKMNIAVKTVRQQIFRMYGDKNQRAQGYIRQPEKEKGPKKINPIITYSQKLIDNNIKIYPININTSTLHIINPSYGISKEGKMYSCAKGNEWREMSLYIDKKGYATVGLNTNHGNKQFMVHRIALSTFCPKEDMYDLEVNHINGIKDDNRLENLEWVTHTENMQHAADNIIERKPQRAPDEDIIAINKYAWSGLSDQEISDKMNGKYTAHNVFIICTGGRTYGPVLEQLGLKPFKYQKLAYSDEEKKELFDFLDSKLGTKMLKELYIEASEKFGYPYNSIKTLYEKERASRRG